MKKYLKTKKNIIRGHQPNADNNAPHLIYPFKFQGDGVAKVNKFFPADLEATNPQISNMDETPSIQ